MERTCVVGAGTMGAGIAQAFAQAGREVLLMDATSEQAENGKEQADRAKPAPRNQSAFLQTLQEKRTKEARHYPARPS